MNYDQEPGYGSIFMVNQNAKNRFAPTDCDSDMRLGELVKRLSRQKEKRSVLAVTMFYDIGRHDKQAYGAQSRTVEDYLGYFASYFAKLDVDKFILCANDNFLGRYKTGFKYICQKPFSSLFAMRHYERTREILHDPEFRSHFGDDLRMESLSASYNIVQLAKMDALEAAFQQTGYDYYAWIDFGIGRRTASDPFLPKPRRFRPILTDRIVLSVDRENRLRDLSDDSLSYRVYNYIEQSAGSFFLIPGYLCEWFITDIRNNYIKLLNMNLTSDDQILYDMSFFTSPDKFRLIQSNNKYRNIHNIINGRI